MSFFLIRETLMMAGRALFANRMRSALALLGIVIGVGTVIGMVSLINGFQRSFQQSIQSIGNNTIYIRRIRPGFQINGQIPDSLRLRHAFTMDDADALLAGCPAVKAISPFKFPWDDLRLQYRGKKTKITFVYGTNQNYLMTHGYDLAQGRFFTEEEVDRRANVVVLGKDTREALFGDASGIGKQVHIGTIPFTVIGEFESKGKFLGNNFDEVAAVPYPVIDKYFAAPPSAPPWFPKKGELFLDAIAVSPDLNEEAQRQISEVLRVRRHLPSNKLNDFAIFTDDAFLQIYQQITGGIVVLMTLISSISLFVGGIGVMNIMLVSVIERTREIGIRMAVGAKPNDVMTQFLVEALALAAVGGVLGLGAGALGAHWMADVYGWKFFFPATTAVIAFAVAGGVGVVFGLYPAIRASQLDPITALRYET